MKGENQETIFHIFSMIKECHLSVMYMKTRTVLPAAIFMVLMSTFQSSLDPAWISIDCGAAGPSFDEITQVSWEVDDQFISTGTNKLLSSTTSQFEMNTLRFFDIGERNCYSLPLYSEAKYLIRAGFYYGNYDNLLRPPSFDLEIDGSLRLTVNTNVSDEPIYHEVIHELRKDKATTDICLIQTQGQVPFISSLEVALVFGDMYMLMQKDKALYLESRINYGANQSVPSQFSRYVDEQNRIWKPEQTSTYRNLYAGYQVNSTVVSAENMPPLMVFLFAIEAHNTSEPMYLQVTFRDNSVKSAYFVFYFWQLPPIHKANETRKFTIYIEGQAKNVTSLGRDNFVVVSVYPVSVTDTAVVAIKSAEGSTLPPLINAMEVYTTINETNSSKPEKMMNYSSLFLVMLYSAAALLGFM